MSETTSGLKENAPTHEIVNKPSPATVPTTASTHEIVNKPAPRNAPVLKCLYCCVENSKCDCYFGISYFNEDGREI